MSFVLFIFLLCQVETTTKVVEKDQDERAEMEKEARKIKLYNACVFLKQPEHQHPFLSNPQARQCVHAGRCSLRA